MWVRVNFYDIGFIILTSGQTACCVLSGKSAHDYTVVTNSKHTDLDYI